MRHLNHQKLEAEKTQAEELKKHNSMIIAIAVLVPILICVIIIAVLYGAGIISGSGGNPSTDFDTRPATEEPYTECPKPASNPVTPVMLAAVVAPPPSRVYTNPST